MLSFPNCKINIGLQILGKRTDGYHGLQTIFYPLPLCDILEIVEDSNRLPVTGYRFTSGGRSIDSANEENLCVKAFHLLKKEFPSLPPVSIHLHKQIPVGAGLGGGSADAAFSLSMMNEIFQLNATEKKLFNLAAALGSDCPFFMLNRPCLATGRGEILKEISLDLSGYKIVVVFPQIQVRTSEMFEKPRTSKQHHSLEETISLPVQKWKGLIINDFEDIVFSDYPEIVAVKSGLYQAGAVYASLSGSGSSVYGIFNRDQAISLSFPEQYFIKAFSLGQ